MLVIRGPLLRVCANDVSTAGVKKEAVENAPDSTWNALETTER